MCEEAFGAFGGFHTATELLMICRFVETDDIHCLAVMIYHLRWIKNGAPYGRGVCFRYAKVMLLSKEQ